MLEEDKQEREELLKELYANPKHIREHEICLMLIQLFEEKELYNYLRGTNKEQRNRRRQCLKKINKKERSC